MRYPIIQYPAGETLWYEVDTMNRRTFWHLLFALMMTLVWGCDLPFFGDDSSDEESASAAPVGDLGLADADPSIPEEAANRMGGQEEGSIPMEGGGGELEGGDPEFATENGGEESVDEGGAFSEDGGEESVD